MNSNEKNIDEKQLLLPQVSTTSTIDSQQQQQQQQQTGQEPPACVICSSSSLSDESSSTTVMTVDETTTTTKNTPKTTKDNTERSSNSELKIPSRLEERTLGSCVSVAASTSSSSSDRLTTMCRICHSDAPVDDLIVPCNCTGSLKYVHQSCLQNWLKINGSKSCEICKEDFVIKVRANSLTRWKKPIMTAEHRRKFLLMNFLYVVAILCNLWSINSFSGVLLMQFRHGIYDWKFYMIVFFSLSTFFCIIWFLVSLVQIWFEFFLKCVRYNQSFVIENRTLKLNNNNNNNNNNKI